MISFRLKRNLDALNRAGPGPRCAGRLPDTLPAYQHRPDLGDTLGIHWRPTQAGAGGPAFAGPI